MPTEKVEKGPNGNSGLALKILATLLGMGVLGTGGAMFVSQQDAQEMVRIGIMQDDQTEMKESIDDNTKGLHAVQGSVIRLEEGQKTMIDSLKRIEAKRNK